MVCMIDEGLHFMRALRVDAKHAALHSQLLARNNDTGLYCFCQHKSL